MAEGDRNQEAVQLTAEQKTYLPNQKLTEQEIKVERANLLGWFVGVLKGDPQIPAELIGKYSDSVDLVGRGGTLSFKRGSAEYFVNTSAKSEDSLFLRRDDGDIRESLTIGREDNPSIMYTVINANAKPDAEYNKTGYNGVRSTNTGLAVNKGLELLTKVKEDFKVAVSKEPAVFTQEQPLITSTEASDSFLKHYMREFVSAVDLLTKPRLAILTEIVGVWLFEHYLGGLRNGLGNVGSDIAERRWGILAAKGIVTGVMAAPFVRGVHIILKKE